MRSKYEKKTEDFLKKQGYLTDYKLRPQFKTRGYNVDYFNLFDHLAYDPKTGTLYMIQVKGHGRCPKELRDKIICFEVNKVVREIWTYTDSGVLKKETFI